MGKRFDVDLQVVEWDGEEITDIESVTVYSCDSEVEATLVHEAIRRMVEEALDKAKETG